MARKGTRGRNPFCQLKPVFIRCNPYAVEIDLSVTTISKPAMISVREFLGRAFPTMNECKLVETDTGFAIHVGIKGPHEGFHFDDEGRRKLDELVKPKYTAFADATAEVIRDHGYHKGTIITLVVTEGSARPLTVDEVNAIDGVLLASVNAGLSKTTISFSLREPTTDNVQTVANAVAKALGLHFKRPVKITDPEPHFALIPAYAYQAQPT